MKYLFLLLLVSCATSQVPVKPPVNGKVLVSEFPGQAWTNHALKEVLSSDLSKYQPRDGFDYCPNGMNPSNWVVLMAAMAKYESNFKPDTEYRENFKDQNGNYVISTGLMQLSQESARGYGCAANSQAWLKDPFNNLSCAVKIIERWVINDGCISCKLGSSWQGGGRYFSVLRYKLDSIKARMKPYCI